MKASIIFIILILLNTTALIAEPITHLLKNINIWILIILEGVLIVAYYINTVLRDLHKIAKIDLSNIDLFVVKSNQ